MFLFQFSSFNLNAKHPKMQNKLFQSYSHYSPVKGLGPGQEATNKILVTGSYTGEDDTPGVPVYSYI